MLTTNQPLYRLHHVLTDQTVHIYLISEGQNLALYRLRVHADGETTEILASGLSRDALLFRAKIDAIKLVTRGYDKTYVFPPLLF